MPPPDDLPSWLDDSTDADSLLPDLSDLFGPDPEPEPPPPLVAAPAAPQPLEYGVALAVPLHATDCRLRVEHDLPAGLTVIGTKPGAVLVGGKKLVWELAGDAVRPDSTVSLRVKAAVAGRPNWTPGDLADFRATFTLAATARTPLLRPELAAEVAGPAELLAGGAGDFRVRVSNAGNCLLTGVAVRATATDGLALAPAAPVGDLAVGASAEVRIRATAVAAGPQSIQMLALAEPGGCSASARVECRITAPELVAHFGAPAAWFVRRDHRLEVVLANRGTAAADVAVVRLAVPADWDISAPDGRFDPEARTLIWPGRRLEPGESLTSEVVARPAVPGAAAFRLTADALGLPEVAADLAAAAEIDPADSDDILGQFVRAMESDESVDAPAEPAERRANRGDQHVLFRVGGTDYALPLTAVREVGRPPAATPLPRAPEWLAGVANVRGDVVSLVDLRLFLGGRPVAIDAGRRLLVVQSRRGEVTAGVLVDRVAGLRAVPAAEVARPTAPLDAPWAKYMRGVADLAGRLVVVLDADRLLLAPEFEPFPD